MKKFLIFRTDKLGDFLIITNIIKKIKENYKNSHITVVGSPLNKILLKNYKIIDEIIIFNKNENFFKKIKIINSLLKSNYYAIFTLDGKSISSLITLVANSKYKLGISYKFNIFYNFFWSKPNLFYNFLVFTFYEYFTSKKDLKKIEHLPSLIMKLANRLNFQINSKQLYYFPVSKKYKINFKKIYNKKIKSRYVLIHFDEKWNDIIDIKNNLYEVISIFQKKIKMKVIITSNNNIFDYYITFKQQASLNKNIYILENLNLMLFERFIANSQFSISCHSGFLVQVSGCNQTKIIDIINKKDYLWYSCWKPLNTKHKFVYKSNFNKRIKLKYIFKQILNASKRFK